jgi:hypothetical protein
MLTVEDLLEKLSDICTNPPRWSNGKKAEIQQPWDRKFIMDVAYKTRDGKQISTAQSEIALKVINRFQQNLIVAGVDNIEIQQLLNVPIFRQPPYQSTHLEKEVRWAGRRKLLLRSKFNGSMNEDIARLPNEELGLLGRNLPDFSSEKKGGKNVWVIEVHGQNIEPIMELLKKYSIKGDEETVQFLKKCYDTEMLQSTATLVNGEIKVEVQNDPFLTSWLETLLLPEEKCNVG